MRNTGIVLTLFGAGATVLGIVGAAKAADPCDGACEELEGLSAIPWMITSISGFSIGAVALSIGIPLWAIGAQDEEVSPDDPRAREATNLRPRVTVGPTSLQLGWQF